MKTGFAPFQLCVCAVLVLGVAFPAAAQNKAAKPPKTANFQGRVEILSKDKSTITIARGTTRRDIKYDADTKFLYGHSRDNKPGSLDQIKEGYFVSCQATPAGGTMLAKVCVYRETP